MGARSEDPFDSFDDEARTNRVERPDALADLDGDLSLYATLHAAVDRLHASLDFAQTAARLGDLFGQLIGAASHAVYLVDEGPEAAPGESTPAGARARRLVPVTCEGTPRSELPVASLGGWGGDATPGADLLARVFLTGDRLVERAHLGLCNVDAPAACLPLRLGDRTAGVAVIHRVHPHKDRFEAQDFALFALAETHAAGALVAALLFRATEGKIPPLEGALDHDAVARPRSARDDAERGQDRR